MCNNNCGFGGGSKLSDTLISRGVFSDAAYRASRAMVNSARIG